MKVATGLGLLLAFSSFANESWQSIPLSATLGGARDIQIPVSLVKRIEREYIATFRQRRPDDEISDRDLLAQYQRKLLPIHLWLEPLKGGALKEPVRFSPPIGGGEIDLSHFIQDQVGRFQVGLAAAPPDGISASGLKVYFLPAGRERSLAGERIGGGCHSVLDLSRFYQAEWSVRPLVVYTRQQRYVSLLAGTYFFILYDPPQLWLAALALTDSRYPALLCS